MSKPNPLRYVYHNTPLTKKLLAPSVIRTILVPRERKVPSLPKPKQKKQLAPAANSPQLIGMDSIYLKLNIYSNPTICAVCDKYPRLQRFNRVKLFECFPASERPFVHTTLRNAAAALSPFEASLTPRSQAHQERKKPVNQKTKQAVGFGLDAPTLAAIFTYLVSQFRPVMEAQWQGWPEPYARYTTQNWKYGPLVAVGNPVMDITDSVLADLKSMCRDGAGTALIEGFLIRPQRNKKINPPSEKEFGDIGVPFAAPFRPQTQIPASEQDVSKCSKLKPPTPYTQT